MLKNITLLLLALSFVSCGTNIEKENIDNEEKTSINYIDKKWLWEIWWEANTKVEKGFKN